MQIDIDKIKEDKAQYVFEVVLSENDRIPPFTVTLDKDYYKKLTDNTVSSEVLIEKSFEFLLGREPQESILKEFNLKIISTYFPEYEEEIRKHFTG